MAIEEPYFTYAMEFNDWGNSASSEIIRIHGGISSHILAELRQSNGIQRCNGSDGLLLQMEGKLNDKFKKNWIRRIGWDGLLGILECIDTSILQYRAVITLIGRERNKQLYQCNFC